MLCLPVANCSCRNSRCRFSSASRAFFASSSSLRDCSEVDIFATTSKGENEDLNTVVAHVDVLALAPAVEC